MAIASPKRKRKLPLFPERKGKKEGPRAVDRASREFKIALISAATKKKEKGESQSQGPAWGGKLSGGEAKGEGD